MRARETRTYKITAGTTGAGVIVGGGLIGDDGANETIGDVSRATIGEWKWDGSDSRMGADDVLRVTIGTRAGAAMI